MRSGAAARTWMQLSKATASDGATNDNFGISVAVSGNTVVIGAPGDAGKGAAYAFTPGVPSIITVASNPAGLWFHCRGYRLPVWHPDDALRPAGRGGLHDCFHVAGAERRGQRELHLPSVER